MTRSRPTWFRQLSSCSLACAALLAVATVASAQQQPGQGRRPGGFGGGFGGFGGGAGGGDWSFLLRSEQVQKELELVDDQKEGIKKIADAAREGFTGFQGLRDLSEEERNKKLAELREKGEAMAKETKKKYQEVLLPHQAERLDQISIQVRGGGALNDPEVATKLAITDEQKQQLTKVQEEMREKAGTVFQRGGQGGGAEDFQKKMTEFREASNTAYLAVLTSEQKEQFEKMKGEKFELDMSQMRRPGGPGGTGGGDGQGGQPRRRPDNNNNN